MEQECRYMWHETIWIAEDVGAPAAKGCRAIGERFDPGGRGPSGERLGILGLPLEQDACGGRTGGLGAQAHAGSAPKAEGRRTPAPPRIAFTGGLGVRFCQRSVDPEAYRQGDSQRVRRKVSPQPCLASAARVQLVLPGSRAPSAATRRKGHRPLEAVSLAAYKKRRYDLGPIWPFSMKVAFCSSRPAGGLGGHAGRLPSFAIATNTTAFRPWLPLPSRRSASIWGFTSASNRTTSKVSTWPPSCGNCSITCGGTSSSFGTKGAITKDRTWPGCGKTTGACISSGSPATPRNSIPPSRSGTISRDTRPTACPATAKISATTFMPILAVSAAPKPNCDPSSFPPTCRHRRGSFPLLMRNSIDSVTFFPASPDSKMCIFSESMYTFTTSCTLISMQGSVLAMNLMPVLLVR